MEAINDLKTRLLNEARESGEILVDEGIYEDIEEYIDEQRESLDNSISIIKEEFKKMLEDIEVDEKDIKLILKNFDTNGTASITILEMLGFNIVEDKEDENCKLVLEGEKEEIEKIELERILKAIRVADYRHNNTDYDSIDKSKMNDEQVAELRKYFNI